MENMNTDLEPNQEEAVNLPFDMYIACPYSHEDAQVRQDRFGMATSYAVHCMNDGMSPFSPLTHCHPMTSFGLPGSWAFWEKVDSRIIPYCKTLHILCAEGYHESTGVKAEYAIAKSFGVPVTFVIVLQDGNSLEFVELEEKEEVEQLLLSFPEIIEEITKEYLEGTDNAS